MLVTINYGGCSVGICFLFEIRSFENN